MKNEPISTLMQVRTETLSADDTVEAAETLLTQLGLSWAPVIDDGGVLIGVVSKTDLVRFHLDKRDPVATPIWRMCTYRPITVSPETPIASVARSMVDSHVHHVVVSDRGAIRGVVSALDFVRTFL